MNYNFVEKIHSTNAFVKKNIDALPDWYVLRAGEQTNGYGRFERVWQCEKNKDIAMSIVMPYFPNLTQIIAVSIAETLDNFALVTQIKWANDILVGGRKISGILVESQSIGNKIKVVAGIGLNVNSLRKNQSEFLATSLFDETQIEYDLDELAKNIVEKIAVNVQKNFTEYHGIINEKLAYKGETKTIIDGEKRISGVILGVGEKGELIIRTKNGEEKFISGEIGFEK